MTSRARRATITGLGLIAALCAANIATPAGQPPELIPRELLLGAADRTTASVSPDGKLIAFLAPVQGVTNVWVAPIDAIAQARCVTRAGERPISTYYWSPDSNEILYVRDHDGDENYQLFGVRLSDAPLRPGGAAESAADPAIGYTPFAHTNVGIVAVSPLVPHTILISLNRRDPHWPDVYRLSLASGNLELVWTNPGGYRRVIADPHLQLRLAEKARQDGGYEVDRFLSNGSLQPLLVTGFDDSQTTAVVSVAANGRTVYLLDSRGRDTAALESLDLKTGTERVLAVSPTVDIASNSDGGVGGANTLIMDPRTGEVQAYSVNDLMLKWMPVGDALRNDIAFLDSHAGGQWSIAGQSGDNRLWTVSIDRPRKATQYSLFDRDRGVLTKLFSERPRLEEALLSEIKPVELPARDGRRLVGYLSVPVPSDPSAAAGRPVLRDEPAVAPPPAVLLVHGGPDERAVYGYNGYHQWLTNRGYAVLSLNYRGSTGFGKAFTNRRAWSPQVSNDLLDGIAWLTAHGVGQRDRIAIVGASYGGYSVLAGMTATPNAYACGVDAFGPTDLPALLSRGSIRSEWDANYEHLVRVFGDPRTAAGRRYLQDRSPQTHVDRLVRPVLVAQGANDPRVREVQSDRFVAALQRRGVDVTYLVFPDEGHGFAREVNLLAYAAVAESFLHRCLGGALQPIDGALQGSSMQIPVGVARIPGLASALVAR
jgi:dipeptidyl aminopeptidase/acylaminoacyl peptidase